MNIKLRRTEHYSVLPSLGREHPNSKLQTPGRLNWKKSCEEVQGFNHSYLGSLFSFCRNTVLSSRWPLCLRLDLLFICSQKKKKKKKCNMRKVTLFVACVSSPLCYLGICPPFKWFWQSVKSQALYLNKCANNFCSQVSLFLMVHVRAVSMLH